MIKMWRSIANTVVKACLNEVVPKTNTFNIQPARTTFVLKRKWPPGLHKKNAKPHKLRGRNFVYELVEDTDVKKHEPMEIILTSYVEGLGAKGDIVEVKPNFAYNKLILPKLGVYKTPENIEKFASKKEAKDEIEHSSPFAPKTQNALEHLMLGVVMNKDVPWTLEPWHIRAALRKVGYHAVEEAIQIPDKPISGPDLSLEGKEFYVTITINNFEKANVRCRIHHWSTEPSNRLPYVYEYWKIRAEPIFPEQAEVLDKLPNQFVEQIQDPNVL